MVSENNSIDFHNLANDLKQASRESGQSIYEILESFAIEIQADAQQAAPVRSGKLRASIVVTPGAGKISVGVSDSKVPYAKFQEYGTKGPYEIKAKAGGALKFNIGGTTYFRKKVIHPGVPAHPFIRPAMQNFIDKLGPKAADVGVNLVMGNQ